MGKVKLKLKISARKEEIAFQSIKYSIFKKYSVMLGFSIRSHSLLLVLVSAHTSNHDIFINTFSEFEAKLSRIKTKYLNICNLLHNRLLVTDWLPCNLKRRLDVEAKV